MASHRGLACVLYSTLCPSRCWVVLVQCSAVLLHPGQAYLPVVAGAGACVRGVRWLLPVDTAGGRAASVGSW